MKRLIYAMSFPKRKVLQKMESISAVLNTHVIECIVYKHILPNTIHHWCSEIAAWLSSVNSMKCDSKIKEKDYAETLFSDFGDEISDAKLCIAAYHAENTKNRLYPEFEISDQDAEELLAVWESIYSLSIKTFLSGQIQSTSWWLQQVEDILNKDLTNP